MAFGVAGQNGYACDICHYRLSNLQSSGRARSANGFVSDQAEKSLGVKIHSAEVEIKTCLIEESCSFTLIATNILSFHGYWLIRSAPSSSSALSPRRSILSLIGDFRMAYLDTLSMFWKRHISRPMTSAPKSVLLGKFNITLSLGMVCTAFFDHCRSSTLP